MPQIDPIELANRFQRPGGADWVAFMNTLLWAACWQVGIPESEIRTNRRSDIADGGVDTRVSVGSDRDITGYLGRQSIWQYKAAHEANLSDSKLVAEIQKPYAKERIRNGDAYRLCLAVQLQMRKGRSSKKILPARLRCSVPMHRRQGFSPSTTSLASSAIFPTSSTTTMACSFRAEH